MKWVPLCIIAVTLGCGGGSGDDESTCSAPIAVGDPDGHPDPLGAGPAEARAGRIRGEQLPADLSGLLTWRDQDFVLANDRVALVIEDAGDSDLYDPWGGRPVGLARVENGALVEPANFGEMFLLTGRASVVTDNVSVIADGSDGGPAIIRARGRLHPVPFFEAVIAAVYSDPYDDIEAAIDYELAPGAEEVVVRYRYSVSRAKVTEVPSVVHAFMYTSRTPVFQARRGFDESIEGATHIAFIDDRATSWAYIAGDDKPFGTSLAVSGFLGTFSDGFDLPACGEFDRVHARIVIGGPGVDGIEAAVARATAAGELRAITGTVTRTGGGPVAGVNVHAIGTATDAYLTRARTDANGAFTLQVPVGAAVRLDVARLGEPIVSAAVGAGAGPVEIALPTLGRVHVVATEDGVPRPVRVQVLPAAGSTVSPIPGRYGEPGRPNGRQLVEFPVTGETTLQLPAGSWEIVVSRGYEYELVRQTVNVVAGAQQEVVAQLERSVDTTGSVCADFHIHTSRSNDSGDTGHAKVAQAVADGLELPVRSDHEYVGSFAQEIADLGVGAVAAGMSSVELTSFEVWGHMGVFPLDPRPDEVNAGAPIWQTFPTADAPDRAFATLSAPEVFDAVRTRPEAPVVIINHPRGGANYFDYVGFDPATGLADRPEEMDSKFTLVEVFNDSGWIANKTKNVRDWFGLLRAGRRIFAVGSSDSHGLVTAPAGYPRTCVRVGSDVPAELTPPQVRDALAAGRTVVSGGIYVDATIGGAHPGDTVAGAGFPVQLNITVRAATWIDVDAIDIVVDGEIVDTIPLMPGDADPGDPTVRFAQPVTVQTAATGGFVVVAAYGGSTLEPVHPGRIPFGVTNPIFMVP